MKTLFKFIVPKIIEKDIQVLEKDKDGKDITVVRKEKVEEPVHYFIKRPSRSEYEEAELFHDINFGNDVRKGVLTKSEVIKRFANEDVEIEKVYKNYSEKENELQRILLLEKTDENNERQKKIKEELLNLLIDIQNFEITKSSIFNHTAENRARNKTIVWWIFNLSYQLQGEVENPVFEGNSFEEKGNSYSNMLDSDNEYIKDVIQRFFYLIPAWYTGNLVKEDDFKKAENLLKAEIVKEKEKLKKEAEEDEKAKALETSEASEASKK